MIRPCPIPLLLVDDRPENLIALEALLSEMGLDLDMVKAGTGNEALRHSLKRDFALVLMDVQMPEMDGFETARLLRANPKTRHLPIIFVTAGMNEKAHLFHGYASGAVDYLIKPLEPLVLHGKVRTFCELYAQRVDIEYHKSHLEAMVAERTIELADSELRMRRVIDTTFEAFIGMDEAGNVLDWNGQAELMFGWSKQEALGLAVADLIVPERYRAAHSAGLRHFSATGEGPVLNTRIEISAQHRDGREFAVELGIWVIPHTNTRTFGAFLRDITHRKRAEEDMRQLNEGLETRVEQRTQELKQAMQQIVESEKLASLGGIVAGVAHELNTPIGNIVLTASTLGSRVTELSQATLEGRLSKSVLIESVAEIKYATDLIERSANRASELIASFKQVAVDQTSHRRRVFDLHNTVADIVSTLGSVMRHAKVTSEIRIPAGIVMDSIPGDLEQIFTNLIMNSIHHGFEARGRGHVVIDGSASEGRVEISYQDDGIGIAADLHHKVFEPFYTTKLGRGGSGLGMFIVHNLVHGSLKGEIRLDSESGQGARFTLSLPAVTP